MTLSCFIGICADMILSRSPLEHLFPGSLIVVGEDEPSTIIAYTLSCDDYLTKLKEIQKGNAQTDTTTGDEQSIHGGGGSSSSLHGDCMSEKASVDGVSCTTTTADPATGMVIERTLRSKSGTHMKYCKSSQCILMVIF